MSTENIHSETGNGAKASSITIFDGYVTYTYYLAPSHGKWSIDDLYQAARKVCDSPETPGVKVAADWESLYRAEVDEKDGWKESRQKLLAKLNEVTAQRDELREKYAMHHAEAERLAAENQSLNVQLSLARTMLNGQERRHNEEVAKLNSNYLQAMDSTQIATLIRQAEKYEKLKETIRIFVE